MKKKEKEEQYFLVCPNCLQNIPDLSLYTKNNSITLKVSCTCKIEKEFIIDIKEFINIIQGYHEITKRNIQEIKKSDQNPTKNKGTTINDLLNITCPEHKKDYLKYCQQCNQSLCEKCLNLSKHQQHSFQDIQSQSSYQTIISKIENIMTINLETKIEFTKKIKAKIERLNQKILQLNQMNQEISSFFRNNHSINTDLKYLYQVLYQTIKTIKKPSYHLNKLFLSMKINEEVLTKKDLALEIDKMYQVLKKQFSCNYVIYQKDNQYEHITTIKGHSHFVNCLIQLNNEVIVSGSYDNTIKVWNNKHYNNTLTLTNHASFVSCLTQVNQNLFASGSWDNSIKLWAIDRFTCVNTLIGHSKAVYCLSSLYQRELLASGSEDCTIKLWNLSNGKCVSTLTDHAGPIHALVELNNKILASASRDKSIKLWTENNSIQGNLYGHSSTVSCLAKLNNNLLVSGSWDKLIKIWNTDTFTCESTLNGHSESVSCIIELNDNEIVSGSYDNTIKIWNIQFVNEWKEKKTLNEHCDSVLNLIKGSNGEIISCSKDKTIIIRKGK